MFRRRPRKLFFMHIAKAGGSTVNEFLLSRFPPGRMQVHIQSSDAWQEDPKSLHGFDGLSGHVDLKTLDRRLGLDGYHLVTVMRHPYRQLVSHLAWIRRLAQPGEEQRLHQHPPYVQNLAAKLEACDFRDAASVTAFRQSLEAQERGLLDNVQVRYFSAPETPWVDKVSCEDACVALERFDRVGVVEQLDEFLRGLAGDMGWRKPGPAARTNVTPEFFGLEDPGEAVREALKPLWMHDEKLYDAAVQRMKGRSWFGL